MPFLRSVSLLPVSMDQLTMNFRGQKSYEVTQIIARQSFESVQDLNLRLGNQITDSNE